MIRILQIEISGKTQRCDFAGKIEFEPGVNVISAKNSFGKSLAVTAVAWCLGLEPMYGSQNNDPSRFPIAVRERIDLDELGEQPVLKAEARLWLAKPEGLSVQIIRSIHGASPEVVEVQEYSNNQLVRKSQLFARKKTMADETGGLQRFLYEWMHLPHVPLMTTKGEEAQIYLENLAPLFLIDQNEGWTDLQALQVYRYGLQDVAEAAVEYLLGSKGGLASRLLEQKIVSRDAKLKAEASIIVDRIVSVFKKQGFVINWNVHGSPSDIATRWRKRKLVTIAKADFQMDFAAERQRLESRAVAFRKTLTSGFIDPMDATPSSDASQRVVDLKTRRHELRSALRIASEQRVQQATILDTIEHRIHSSNDVLRLKQRGIGRLEQVECPTCHRHLEPNAFSLDEQAESSVEAHIQALQKERQLISHNIASLEAEIVRLVRFVEETETQLRFAEQTLMSVNTSLGTVREKLSKTAFELTEAERQLDALSSFSDEVEGVQREIDNWIAKVDSSGAQELGASDAAAHRREFAKQLRLMLRALGHSAVKSHNMSEVELDERYVPYLGARRLRSLGSASDQSRLVAAYVLALAQAARVLKGPHPGFVVLDEPLQQNPDKEHRNLAVDSLVGLNTSHVGQVIVFTSLYPLEINRLRKEGVNVRGLVGEHFLRPVGLIAK